MPKTPNLLLIGLDFKTLGLFEHLLKDIKVQSIPLEIDRIQQISAIETNIIITSALENSSPKKIVQELRKRYPQAIIHLISHAPENFIREEFVSCGFTNAFLMPSDAELFIGALKEAISGSSGADVKEYQVVKMPDAELGDKLDFDVIVFLPTNDRYVRILKAGDIIDESRLEMINSCQLFVPVNQNKNFYEYSAQKLKRISTSKTLSKEERKEKLVEAVKNLMGGLFTEGEGTELTAEAVMKNCNGIVSAYIVSTAENDWFARIQQVLAEMGDRYSHSANVSTLAALFSIGLSIGSPEDLALAGLLHDIGKMTLPEDVQTAEPDEMNGTQFNHYRKHPELSIEIIKQKKLKVPNTVIKAILQHHEHYNGTGFPKKLFGVDICKEAQLLALADRFDHLTKTKPGRKPISPTHAVEMMRMDQFNGTAKQHYDPVLLKNLLALFPAPKVVV